VYPHLNITTEPRHTERVRQSAFLPVT